MKKPQNYSKLKKKIIDSIEETGCFKVLHSDIISSETDSSSYEHKFGSLVYELETKKLYIDIDAINNTFYIASGNRITVEEFKGLYNFYEEHKKAIILYKGKDK